MKVWVVTISDRASRGEYQDRSGPAVQALIQEAYPTAEVTITVVPDEDGPITAALAAGLGAEVIITNGGTGLGPRDITPEVTARFCDRAAPGISEALRAQAMLETPNAMLSRSYAGMKGQTLVVNVPGSVRGASSAVRTLLPVLGHALKMLGGGGH